MKSSARLLILFFGLLALLATPAAEALPPVISVSDATAEATGPSGATVDYTVTVIANPGPADVVCSPPSGSTFPLGTTSVSCTATDTTTGETATANGNVTVQDTTAPVVSVPGGVTAEAAGPSGATVSYSGVSATDSVSGSLTPSCNHSSGSMFPLGPTTVTCTATDGAGNPGSNSFTVTVQDTTPPAVTVPAGPTVEAKGPTTPVPYTGVSATDTVSGNLTPSCSPLSGSPFPVGATTVTCTATDGAGNPGSASFTVTVQDTTGPVVNVPSGQTAEATGPSGASVGYSGVSATDLVNGNLTPSCIPPSGSTFPLGGSSVNCTATDGSGNVGSNNFTVTVRDTTAPVVTVPSPVTAEATSSAGANVSYSVSAADTVSGNLTPNCNKPSGSTFPLGATSVTCTATDGSGNPASGSFTVTVRDTSGPGFGDAPGDIVVEASGPKGSLVKFSNPVAVDAVDGPVTTSCSPASGATFPFGSTTVDCNARDQRGNARGISFLVTVADKTIPVLTVPAPVTVSSAGAESLPATAAALAAFLNSAVASDLVDGKLPVKVEAPAVFGLGKTTVKFSAADKSGNYTTSNSSVTVVKEAVAPTKPLDRTPPENVRALRAKAGNRAVTLTWMPPPDADFQHVVISRATQGAASVDSAVYKGPAKQFVDRRLTNGVAYRYVVVSYDQAGNRSAGVAIVAAPKALMLFSPSDGARVKAPPHLRWVRIPGATYYNIQLFRGAARVKILSIWPGTNHLQLASKWVFERRRQRLVPGVYRWFVWPGFGRQVAKNYGPLLGESTFTVVAGKKK